MPSPVQRCNMLPIQTELQHRLPLAPGLHPLCHAGSAACAGAESSVGAAGCLQLCVFGPAVTQLCLCLGQLSPSSVCVGVSSHPVVCVGVSSHPALSTTQGSCNRSDESRGYSPTFAMGREQKGYLYSKTALNVLHCCFISCLRSRGHQNNINGNNNIW